MIQPARFFDALTEEGVRFYAGVPDSLLKEACRYISDQMHDDNHVVTANEGSAIALAAGRHLATGEVPLVYLQNSGLGNTINPLLSLCDPEVYAIPIILLIGWRGEPSVKDEPQHVKQGRVTEALLNAMEIPFRILDGSSDAAIDAATWAVGTARNKGGPVALLARKGAFANVEPGMGEQPSSYSYSVSREAAIEQIVKGFGSETIFVASTGMIGRELYEFRRRVGADASTDFLTVGSMGHASQIALGIARVQEGRRVVCLDGDGALLMHMGGMTSIGASRATNFLHVVLNNGAHASVGGQPTVAFDIDLAAVARACGYRLALGGISDIESLSRQVSAISSERGPAFLEIRVSTAVRSDLGRPKEAPIQNKKIFMERLETDLFK